MTNKVLLHKYKWLNSILHKKQKLYNNYNELVTQIYQQLHRQMRQACYKSTTNNSVKAKRIDKYGNRTALREQQYSRKAFLEKNILLQEPLAD